MYRIIVTEVISAQDAQQAGVGEIKRLEMTVDTLDLNKVIAAVNSKPRKPRVKKGERA